MNFDALKIDEAAGEALFSVHARPRSKRAGVEGVREGALEVAVRAAPQDGEANEAILEVMAEVLDVPKRSVRLVRGGSSRYKRLAVAGLSAAELRARLGTAPSRA